VEENEEPTQAEPEAPPEVIEPEVGEPEVIEEVVEPEVSPEVVEPQHNRRRVRPRARTHGGTFEVVVGLDYNGRRVEPGDVVSDLPADAVDVLLDQGAIKPVGESGQSEDGEA